MSDRCGGQFLTMGETLVDLIVADGAPDLSHADHLDVRSGGAPANAAVAMARLGLPAAFAGAVGADPLGERLRREMAAEGVNVARLRAAATATSIAFAWKDERGDGHFWFLRGADATLSPSDAAAAGIPDLAALIVGSVALSAEPSRHAIWRAVGLAKASGVPVVFDVNLRPALWPDLAAAYDACQPVFAAARLVKLSLDDARGLFGAEIDPAQAFDRLAVLAPAANVVLTDGERGCWGPGKVGAEPLHVPAFAVAAVEPTGAGDAFTAALVQRVAERGWEAPTREDLRYAAAAGALATTKPGAWDGLPTVAQLDAFLAAH
ncbi:MAG: carbohydrate kinase [Thermomicrobiales bacterium]|nr:carbohydrate kinase [Thermomicrobiales bacterium]